MSSILAPPKTYSLDDYRQLEETAEERHEYHDGEIILMTGGTLIHARIISNLIFLLRLALQTTPFEVYGGELRIWIPEHSRGLYPDLSLFEGEPVLTENRQDEVLNPCGLMEVLSPSTEAYDRGQKFRFYRSIPSLRDYFLISQTEPLIEHFQRTEDDRWILSAYQGLETCFTFATARITLAQVYEGVPLQEA
ncbi:MAG: Uma2 family endonuclease [Prochlorotrichaceae cyanobacterium]